MGVKATLGAVLAATVAAPGCFGPSLPALSCAEDGICPPGQACDPVDLTCGPVDRDSPDGGATDGAADGPILSVFCSDPDVVLCLEFEDTIADGSARNNSVSTPGTPQYTESGVVGRALALDGGSELLVANYRPGTPSETIEFWMTMPTFLQRQIAVASETEVAIGAESNNVVIVSGINTGTSANVMGIGFHHVAVRIENGRAELIVDGGGSTANIAFTDGASDPDMVIGGNFGEEGYVGSIDSLRVWTRALSDMEISEIASN